MQDLQSCEFGAAHAPPLQHVLCPLATEHPRAAREPENPEDVIETRAYKLGKKRWSYNQCALTLHQANGAKTLSVAEAASSQQSVPESQQESGVGYAVTLTNGERIRVLVYVVADEPVVVVVPGAPVEERYQWATIRRSSCCKGCTGPILRAIQRFGRQGRRSGCPDSPEKLIRVRSGRGAQGKLAMARIAKACREGSEDLKDTRFLYLSIDEAGTHVGKRHFRLLAGVYDSDTMQLLGTGLSSPIRVLANNDVPTGAAYINLDVSLLHGWQGWNKAEHIGRPPSARTSLMRTTSGHVTPDTPMLPDSPFNLTRSQSSSETSHPAARQGVAESPELGSSETTRHTGGDVGAVRFQDQGLPPASRHSAQLLGGHAVLGGSTATDRRWLRASLAGKRGASTGARMEDQLVGSLPTETFQDFNKMLTDAAEALHGTRDGGGMPSPAKSPGAVRALSKRRWSSSPQMGASYGTATGGQPSAVHPAGALTRRGTLPSLDGNPALHPTLNTLFEHSTVLSPFRGGMPFGTGREGHQPYTGEMCGAPAMQTLTSPTPSYNHLSISPTLPDLNSRWTLSPGAATCIHHGHAQQQLRMLMQQEQQQQQMMQRTQSLPSSQHLPHPTLGQQLQRHAEMLELAVPDPIPSLWQQQQQQQQVESLTLQALPRSSSVAPMPQGVYTAAQYGRLAGESPSDPFAIAHGLIGMPDYPDEGHTLMSVFGEPASPMAPYGFQSAMYQQPHDLPTTCLPPFQGGSTTPGIDSWMMQPTAEMPHMRTSTPECGLGAASFEPLPLLLSSARADAAANHAGMFISSPVDSAVDELCGQDIA